MLPMNDLWILGAGVGAFVMTRVAKFLPKFPAKWLPLLALTSGYLAMLAKLLLLDGVGGTGAMIAAWDGVVGGALAVGAHSTLRSVLSGALGDNIEHHLEDPPISKPALWWGAAL